MKTAYYNVALWHHTKPVPWTIGLIFGFLILVLSLGLTLAA